MTGAFRVLMGFFGLGAVATAVAFGVKARDERYVEGLWQTLQAVREGSEPFTPEMVTGLPDPARRYFLHAIQPGTPVASKVLLGYSGTLRTARNAPWMDLSARQISVKNRGFVWRAKVHQGPLLITGSDHYLDGDARMRIAVLGLFPVVNATGPDLIKSALPRLTMEGLLLPSSFLPGPNVQIDEVDDSHFKVTVSLHGESVPMTVAVDEEGRPTELVLPRWGDLTPDRSFRHIPYGIAVEGDRTFGGYTVPARIRGGWWYGTADYLEVIRIEMDWAEFH